MIEKNKVISISYSLKDTQGEELDRADIDKPLEYLHGSGNIVPGLENALEGLKVGDKKEVTVEPKDGYGEIMTDLKMEVDRKAFPTDQKIATGMQFMAELADGKKHPFNVVDIKDDKFSSSVKSLLTDLKFLKKEILKVNANKPSIQRILIEADNLWMKKDLKQASSTLERGLRIAKDESALYLRLAHLRLEQGLAKESSAFAERGLLNKSASSWELLLLKIYSVQKI